MLKGEAQDPLRLCGVRRTGDVVERSRAESPHVRIPIGQMRKHDDGSSAGGGCQNSNRRAHVAIRQIVVAEHKLKCFVLDEGPRVGERAAGDAFQSEALNNFRCVATLKGIGRYH